MSLGGKFWRIFSCKEAYMTSCRLQSPYYGQGKSLFSVVDEHGAKFHTL